MSKNQREDVRQRIVDCAVEEFLLYGYSGSSMRNISTQAGMTVGNVYAYFSSKDDLFDRVVEPARRGIDSLLAMDVGPITNGPGLTVLQISEAIVQVFLGYRSAFLILMNGSAGSKYENVREDMVALISKRISQEFLSQVAPKAQEDSLLATSLAAALLEGFMRVFNGYGGDSNRLAKVLQELLIIMLGSASDIQALYESVGEEA
jgi:AcrR family transcriptional regulator